MYIHEGKLSGSDVYDTSLYSNEMNQSDCQIFPTDFKLFSRVTFDTNQRIFKVITIEEKNTKDSVATVRGYAYVYSRSIIEFEMTH